MATNDEPIAPELTEAMDRLMKRVRKLERERCYGLARDAALERQSSGDPEGEGVLRDLMRDIRGEP